MDNEQSIINNGNKLFSSGQVGLAALIGGPIASIWLFSKNYIAVDEQHKVMATILSGIGIIALLIFISVTFNFSGAGSAGAIAGVSYAMTKQLLNGKYQEHFENSGAKQSWWLAVGLGLLSLLIVLILLFITIYISSVTNSVQ